MTQTGQKRDGRNRKIPVNAELLHLKYVHIIIKIQKNTNGWLLTCMGSQVRVLYCPPSSCTQIDAAAKSPEVSTTSGFFCAQFLKSEKKISKRVLAKSVDLNLYARDFGPLFREFFGEAALFYSRQNVEFEQVFLLVLLDGHSECMCHCVDTGKAQNTLGGFKMTIENAKALQEQLANEAIAQLRKNGNNELVDDCIQSIAVVGKA